MGLTFLMLLLCLDYVPPMGFFYGLDYAFAYTCFYDTSMGHFTW
jgi:hypothetical protein